MVLRTVSAFRTIRHMHLKLVLSNPVPHELRKLHTTRPVRFDDWLSGFDASWGKLGADVVPAAVDSGLYANIMGQSSGPRLRSHLTPGSKPQPVVVQDLDGPGVRAANQLLGQLIEANEIEFPELTSCKGLGPIRHVVVCVRPTRYVGISSETLWVSTDILTALPQNELLMLFATEIAHHLCNHNPQPEAKNQCLIADDLALKMASKMGVTEQDAASLLEKLIKFRESAAIPQPREE